MVSTLISKKIDHKTSVCYTFQNNLAIVKGKQSPFDLTKVPFVFVIVRKAVRVSVIIPIYEFFQRYFDRQMAAQSYDENDSISYE